MHNDELFMLAPLMINFRYYPKHSHTAPHTFSSHAHLRAETTRILLNYGGIPFEDFVFQKEQWAELKPKMPFGQVPVLEVSGLAEHCQLRRGQGV